MAVSSEEQFCSWCGILICDEKRKELKEKK